MNNGIVHTVRILELFLYSDNPESFAIIGCFRSASGQKRVDELYNYCATAGD